MRHQHATASARVTPSTHAYGPITRVIPPGATHFDGTSFLREWTTGRTWHKWVDRSWVETTYTLWPGAARIMPPQADTTTAVSPS